MFLSITFLLSIFTGRSQSAILHIRPNHITVFFTITSPIPDSPKTSLTTMLLLLLHSPSSMLPPNILQRTFLSYHFHQMFIQNSCLISKDYDEYYDSLTYKLLLFIVSRQMFLKSIHTPRSCHKSSLNVTIVPCVTIITILSVCVFPCHIFHIMSS